MTSRILSINCGKAVAFRGVETSAIVKGAVAGCVRVGPLGLAGDEQADLSVHGGVDKALHHYPHEHYAWWREQVGDLAPLTDFGAFGENIATGDLDENAVCIGDRWRLGTALVEVSQGRQPCWKLDHRFGVPVLARMIKSRRCGWYYRTLEPGDVAAGDTLRLEHRPFSGWTVARVFGLLIAGDHKSDRDSLIALGEVDALADVWKQRRETLLG